MPQSLPIVAQYTEDQYYQNYRPASAFFDKADFIFHTRQRVAEIYQKYYNEKYQEIRGEKKDEVISFDAPLLLEEIIDVEDKGGELSAKLSSTYMVFLNDNQTSGIQQIIPMEQTGCELERVGKAQIWQLKYMAVSNRIFFFGDTCQTIGFFKKGICTIKKVRVLFVPAVHDQMLIPDGIVAQVITETVAFMRAMDKDYVVKKSLDQNQNKNFATEANLKK